MGSTPGPGSARKGAAFFVDSLTSFCTTWSRKPDIHMESSSAAFVGPGRIIVSLGNATLSYGIYLLTSGSLLSEK